MAQHPTNAITRLFTSIGEGMLLALAVARARPVERRAVFRQAHELANRSIFFITVTMAFTGVILVVQAASQARSIIGDLSLIGSAFLQLLVTEFGPTITALMIAARYGAGVAAELGAMTITDQVDALRMTGAEPVAYLVAPRVWGGVIGMLPITVLGSVVAYLAGGLAMHYGYAVPWDAYFDTRLTGVADAVVGAVKTLAFGAAVPLVAARAGLQASGGAPGVGLATTRAVIGASVTLLALDLIIGLCGYAVVAHT